MRNRFFIYIVSLFACVSLVACGSDDDQYVGDISGQTQNDNSGTTSGGDNQNQGNNGGDNKAPDGVEAVDLGLSVKWASCNVGASNPEEYGDYFAWGETEGYNSGKTCFSWSTYKWCNGSATAITKYCTHTSNGNMDNKTTLEPEDDAATVNWGSKWRMPTNAELDELRNTSNCRWTLITKNGVNGYEVTSKKTKKSIFLPAAGHCDSSSSLSDAGRDGFYWSSSLDMNSDVVNNLYFNLNDVDWNVLNDGKRCRGRSVRAVCQ